MPIDDGASKCSFLSPFHFIMIVARWNCRGAAFPLVIKDILRKHGINVLCLVETR